MPEETSAIGRVVRCDRFMDSLDAGLAIEQWLEGLGLRLTPGSAFVSRYGLNIENSPTAMPNGRVVVVWSGTRQVGLATVVRDELNFSVLTIVERDLAGD